MFPLCCFTVVVLRAAVMCWRVYQSISGLQFFIIIQISTRKRNTGKGWKNSSVLSARYPISFLEGNYEKDRFYQSVKGYEKEPEGGARCEICFRLRLGEAIKVAESGGFDYVTTTLTISPMKNAPLLNTIGEELCQNTKVNWLPSDFKKKNGYKRSTELSREYGMYRQDYCGCVYSLR